jgi:membrane-associated phospholipid phosphatase
VSIKRTVRLAKMGVVRAVGAALPYGFWDFLFQIGILSSCYWLYTFTRAMVRGDEAVAMHNASVIMNVEKALGIFREPWLQAKASHVEWLIRGLGWFWSNVHLPVILGCLLWMYFARRHYYGFFRNWFLTINVLGIAMYTMLPTAPPRLVPSSGIVDTMYVLSPHSLPWGITSSTANPYAAMPSLHMAYALFVACCVVLLSRSVWAKWLFGLYPVVIGFAIIVTGNHWFLDALAGALVTFTAYVVCARVSRQSVPSLQPAEALIRLTDDR